MVLRSFSRGRRALLVAIMASVVVSVLTVFGHIAMAGTVNGDNGGVGSAFNDS
mgnify:FL=1